MADKNTSEEILVFKVDQGAAVTDLEKLRKTMIGLKEEQKQLSDAYKKGDITVEEYAKEITRVDTLLKKVATSHNQQQKALAGVQTETSKLIKSNQQLSQSLEDSASQINVAGVNVGQLTTKITSLANPVTASIALIGALGAAYARSTIGAKDLAFAQSQLSSALTIVTNDFAGLISSSEDGDGILSRITDRLIAQAGILAGPLGIAASGYFETVAAKSREVALAQEQYEDLLREEIAIRGTLSDRLADNQELLTLINDEQTTFEEKIENINKISKNLKENRSDLLGVLNDELFILNQQLENDKENEDLITKVAEKRREIQKLIADSSKKIEGIDRLEDNIRTQNERQLAAEREKAKLLAIQTAELETQARIAKLQRELAGPGKSPIEQLKSDVAEETKIITGLSKVRADAIKLETDADKSMAKAKADLADQVEASNKRQAKSNNALADSTDAQRDALRLFSSESARLYQTINEENQSFAAAQLVLDAGLTISGITKNTATLGPIAGPIYAAAAVASAAANLARAAKLLGVGSSGFDYTGFKDFDGEIITASSGQKYAIGDKGEVIPIDSNSDIVTNRKGDTFDVNERSTRGLLYRLTHPFRALRRLFSGYAEGGWTGPGDTMDVKGIVHADEYVVPKVVKNSNAAQPHIKALENMRLRGYARGGFTGSANSQDSLVNLREALSSLRIYASITDINKANKRMGTKMRIVTR